MSFDIRVYCRRLLLGKETTVDQKELLFLSKTFSRLTNGGIDLRLDGIGEDYFCDFGDSTDSNEDLEDLLMN